MNKFLCAQCCVRTAIECTPKAVDKYYEIVYNKGVNMVVNYDAFGNHDQMKVH
jgi:hypothetical protein